ncbi:MAG: LytTR family DNA-binding domain-containing protein [Eubacterium sp.]|nr:LytTR family DNA-binding domain-containing protein [Eubacterium sp.]
MNLNIAICDDDHEDAKRLSDFLTRYSFQMEIDFNISLFKDRNDLMGKINPAYTFPYQLVFLDIEMPGESGINLAHELNQIIPDDTLLVFVSSYPEYMSDSFSVHPFDFLQKPITYDKIMNLLSEVRKRLAKRQRQLMIVSKDALSVSLLAEDILYVQSKNSKSQELIVYTKTDVYQRHGTLSDMETTYPDLFFPLNRSILVNLLHVHYLTDSSVILHNGTELPVSVRNRKNLIKLLKSNLTIRI